MTDTPTLPTPTIILSVADREISMPLATFASGITPRRAELLAWLHSHPSASVRAASKALDRASCSVTRDLRELAAVGLVDVAPAVRDGRHGLDMRVADIRGGRDPPWRLTVRRLPENRGIPTRDANQAPAASPSKYFTAR